ncbi:MAG TPA: transposase [Niabella sp.]|jgi:transposase|nr:transposase [Niabella sp.]
MVKGFVREQVRYSISFKQKVVKEVESGLAIEAVRRRYDIGGGSTIQKWIRQFGKHHLLNKIVRVETRDEKDRVKELEAEVKKLKLALADSMLENRALETLIEIVDEHYDTDVKKNFAQQSSVDVVKKVRK